MNPHRVLSLLLLVLALVMGGCKTQPPSPQVGVIEFTLETAMRDGKMLFVGVGGDIDRTVNPDLSVNVGDTVQVMIVNGDGIPHDLAVPELNVHSALVSTKAQTTQVVFKPGEPGEFVYYCAIAGHRQMGMEGKLIVTEP
jgi:nitrite reductase (NO-forming)